VSVRVVYSFYHAYFLILRCINTCDPYLYIFGAIIFGKMKIKIRVKIPSDYELIGIRNRKEFLKSIRGEY